MQKLESDKLLIKEKLATVGSPVSSFDDTLSTALASSQTLAIYGVRSGWRIVVQS